MEHAHLKHHWGANEVQEHGMDQKLGAEIVTTFGARLRRLYEKDEQLKLPDQMAACLEQLKRAEQSRTAAAAPHCELKEER